MLTRRLPFTLYQFLCFLAIAVVVIGASGCAFNQGSLNPDLWCHASDGKAMVSLSAQGVTTTGGGGVGNWLPAADRLCASLAPAPVPLPPAAVAPSK